MLVELQKQINNLEMKVRKLHEDNLFLLNEIENILLYLYDMCLARKEKGEQIDNHLEIIRHKIYDKRYELYQDEGPKRDGREA